MALYFIGDLQGCHAPLVRLLQHIDFSPSRDTIYLLGDLVNRGPGSLEVLQSLAELGDSAQCLLGNHDLHLLAVGSGLHPQKNGDTLQQVLSSPDRENLLDWLRHRSMALYQHGWLMVHAGVLPSWSVSQTVSLAREVEQVLRGPRWPEFLSQMYGNKPARWSEALQGADRLRVIVNVLTRLRFCTADGEMEFKANQGADNPPSGYVPWFEVPGRQSAETPIAFGHWSTLTTDKGHASPLMRNNVLGLDTGCVWGGCLTAARLGAKAGQFELFSIDCPKTSKP